MGDNDTLTQLPPLLQRVPRRQSPAVAAMAAAAAFADLMVARTAPLSPPPRYDTPPSVSQTPPLPPRTQNDTSTGSQNNNQVQNIDTGGQNNNELIFRQLQLQELMVLTTNKPVPSVN